MAFWQRQNYMDTKQVAGGRCDYKGLTTGEAFGDKTVLYIDFGISYMTMYIC